MNQNKSWTAGTFRGMRALVVGDCMLDRYLHGMVGRISPEAPVPVVSVTGQCDCLGGAANVAAGIAALGGTVELAGVIGADAAGEQLRLLCAEAGVGFDLLLEQAAVTTVCKTRIVAGKFQQLLRLDQDGSKSAREPSVEHYTQLVSQLQDFDVCVLADYEKGTLSPPLVTQIVRACRRAGVPCVVDPKKVDSTPYAGATVLTPNVLELEHVVGRPLPSHDAIIAAAKDLRSRLELDWLLCTRGAEGMLLVSETETTSIPAQVHEVADVTGAGDTVVAVVALCLAKGWDMRAACQLATLAAGITVSQPRTYVVTAAELEQAAGGRSTKILDWTAAAARVRAARATGRRIVFTNGCFDILHAGHLSCLEQAKCLGDVLVLGLNSDASVRCNKGPSRPRIGQWHRAALLAGLACVDLVVLFDQETPEQLIYRLAPDVLVKGGDYDADQIVGADFVRRRGGEVVTLPLLQGLSTTAILRDEVAKV
jgi:D-beta-D-heptose 7-phosphate kinase/D-beta-D-heptose 1-phosphate adenosyltransferase